MTSNISGSHFHNSNVAIVNQGFSQSGIQRLEGFCNEKAAYNSYAREDKASCYEGTRTQHIHDITAWTTSATPQQNRFLWVYGPAGVGKTTIAQSCAEAVADHGALGASYFFTRDNRVVDPHQLFPTIAYQLSTHILQYRDILGAKINNNPSLLTSRLEAQFNELIIKPLLDFRVQETHPKCVLIDGLDECQDTGAQAKVVKLVADSIRTHGSKIPLLWAIFSRPEPHINAMFSTESVHSLCWIVELPVSRELDAEIRIYLRGALTRRPSNVLNRVSTSNLWPSDKDLDTLVQISAGLFIYATTLARFITDPDSDPKQQLQDVLRFHRDRKESSPDPVAKLDAFYRMILARIPSKVLSVVQRILLLHNKDEVLCTQYLANLSGLSLMGLENHLSRLHAVLTLKQVQHTNVCCHWGSATIFFHHASFMEFLTDSRRSMEFCIDYPGHWTSLILASLPLLNGLHVMNSKCSRDEKVQELKRLLSAVPDDTCALFGKHMFDLRNWLHKRIRCNLFKWAEYALLNPGDVVVRELRHVDFDMFQRTGPIDIDAMLLKKFPDGLRYRIAYLLPPLPASIIVPAVPLDHIYADDPTNVDDVWSLLTTAFDIIVSASGTLSQGDQLRCDNMLRTFQRDAGSEKATQLNSRLGEYVSARTQSTAMIKKAEYADLDEWTLLHTYMNEWDVFEYAIRNLQPILLRKYALSYWALGVFWSIQGTELRLIKAAINIMTSERDGGLIDRDLIHRFVKSIEFDRDPSTWHYDINDFRIPFLRATTEYYTAERTKFLTRSTLQSYLAFAADRLSEEVIIHVGSFFPRDDLGPKGWRAKDESAVACRDALIGDNWESIHAEFEMQLGLDDPMLLGHIYYLAVIRQGCSFDGNDKHLRRLESIFKSHFKKAVSSTVSTVCGIPLTSDGDYAESHFFLLHGIKRRYSETIEQAFRGTKHCFINILKETFDEVLGEHPRLYQAFHNHITDRLQSSNNGFCSNNDKSQRIEILRVGESESLRHPPLPDPPVLKSSQPKTHSAVPKTKELTQAITHIHATPGALVQLSLGNTYSGINSGQTVIGQNTMKQSVYKEGTTPSEQSAAAVSYKRPAVAPGEDSRPAKRSRPVNTKKDELPMDHENDRILATADTGDTAGEGSDDDTT